MGGLDKAVSPPPPDFQMLGTATFPVWSLLELPGMKLSLKSFPLQVLDQGNLPPVLSVPVSMCLPPGSLPVWHHPAVHVPTQPVSPLSSTTRPQPVLSRWPYSIYPDNPFPKGESDESCDPGGLDSGDLATKGALSELVHSIVRVYKYFGKSK